MNLRKFLIFNLFIFLVIVSKQLYAYQQDIVLKYDNIFSSKVLSDEDVYITNVVNWRPPDNRTPTDDEILEYLPFLQRQIDIVKPKFIFLLGGVAVKAILSTPLALGKLRGKWHEYKSLNFEEYILTIASYHPAFLLRSPQYKKQSWEDLQMLQEKLKNES